MANKPPVGNQIDTINRFSPFVQQSFDLNKQDAFVSGLGVDFIHFKALPSPIGQKDRGDYRRNDGVDTITSNGMIYRCAGTVTATIIDNSRSQKRDDGGIIDPSRSRMIMPRFYQDGTRIYMAPGDRVYIADPDADVKVSNYQKMDYETGDNVPMFPIVQMEDDIIDSLNRTYKCGVHFNITQNGNIRWVNGQNNPGIDPDTGKGRVYSLRYLYRAYWYVESLPKEVRITNITNGQVRSPERMPYHAVIVREYIFHNQNRGDSENQLTSKTPQRADAPVVGSLNPNKYVIPVDMSAIGDGEE